MMEQTQTKPRFLKNSRGSKDRGMNCIVHPKKQYTRLCKSCLVFICEKCFISKQHSSCDILSVNSDVDSAINQLKTWLNDDIKDMRNGIFELHTNLVRKKERMLNKRNKTVAEIERFYSRIKEKMIKYLNNKEKELTDELKSSVGEQETVVSEHIGQCNRMRHNLSETSTLLDNLDRLYQNKDKSKADHLQQLHKVSKDLSSYKDSISSVESTRDSFLVIRFIVNPDGERSLYNRKLASVEVINSRNSNSNDSNLERTALEEAEDSMNAPDHRDYLGDGDPSSNSHGLVVEMPHRIIYPQNRRSRSAPRLRPRSEIHVATERHNDEAHNLLTVPKSASASNFFDLANETAAQSNTPDLQSRTFDNVFSSQNRNSPSPVHMSGAGLSSQRQTRSTPVSPNHFQEGDLIDLQSDVQIAPNGTNYDRSSPQEQLESMGNAIDLLLGSADIEDSTEVTGGPASNEGLLARSPSLDTGQPETESTIDRHREGSGESQTSNSEKVPLADTEGTNATDDPPPPYPGEQRPITPPAPGELPPPYQDDAPPPYVRYPESPYQVVGQPRRRLNAVSEQPRCSMIRPVQAPVVRVVMDQRRLDMEGDINRNYRSIKPIGPIKTFTVNEANDRRNSGIFAILYHNEHSFLIVDRWNKKVKYYNDNGESYGGIIFREEPWDITKIANAEYAVTVPQLKSIYKLKASNDNVKTTQVVSTERKYACIAYHAQSDRFVCGQVPQFGEPVIDLIGKDGGPVLLSFKSDNSGISLFSYPRYVKVSCGGVIVVCDWNMKCLILLKLDGTFVGKYKGSNELLFKDPTGIVVNQSTDCIYAIASTCETVHKLSLDCKLQEVFRGPEEFRDGRAIDSLGDRFAIGCKNGLVNVYVATTQTHRV